LTGNEHLSEPRLAGRIREGEFLNRIAADYDVNPGRIAEIKSVCGNPAAD
jgi:hypothetical protein